MRVDREVARGTEDVPLADLIAAARKGDRTAVDRLAEIHLPWIRAVLRTKADPLVRRKESSSDLAQSVCLDALAGLDRFEFRGDASFRSWLYGWIEKKLRSRRRYFLAGKRDIRRELSVRRHSASSDQALLNCYASFCTPSSNAIHDEEVKRVEDALDRLPADQREVVIQAKLLGLPHSEIAAKLGRSAEATRQLLHRALIRLAALLDRGGSGSSTS